MQKFYASMLQGFGSMIEKAVKLHEEQCDLLDFSRRETFAPEQLEAFSTFINDCGRSRGRRIVT